MDVGVAFSVIRIRFAVFYTVGLISGMRSMAPLFPVTHIEPQE